MRPIVSALVPAAGLAYLLTAAWAQDVPRPEGPPDRLPAERPERDAPRDIERPRVEAAERIAALQRTLADLPPEAEERARIKEALAAVKREVAEGRERPVPPPELKERARELQGLRRESAELRELGRHEAAERLLAKARDLEQQLRPVPPQMRVPEPERPARLRPGPDPEVESLQRRVEHLAIAVENLHAAGLHEPAEKLAGELEGNRRELENLIRERRPAEEMGPRFAEMAQMVRGLRAEVAELREVVGRLNARLDELERRAR